MTKVCYRDWLQKRGNAMTLKTKSPLFLCASKVHVKRTASCYKIFVNSDTFLPLSSLPSSFSAKQPGRTSSYYEFKIWRLGSSILQLASSSLRNNDLNGNVQPYWKLWITTTSSQSGYIFITKWLHFNQNKVGLKAKTTSDCIQWPKSCIAVPQSRV